MSRSLTNEADQFVYLCSEAVLEGKYLQSVKSHYGEGNCTISLTGIKPGTSASVSWDEDLGFRVRVIMPDYYYSESSRRVSSAEEAFALVAILDND